MKQVLMKVKLVHMVGGYINKVVTNCYNLFLEKRCRIGQLALYYYVMRNEKNNKTTKQKGVIYE